MLIRKSEVSAEGGVRIGDSGGSHIGIPGVALIIGFKGTVNVFKIFFIIQGFSISAYPFLLVVKR